jgi:large subunit ribosomal protein L4
MPTVKKTVKVTKPKVVIKKAAAIKKTVVVKKAIVKEAPKETGLKLSVYDLKGAIAESLTLPKEIFGAKINNSLMAQAVRVYLANQRRGTLKTKSRGEVAISTRKIYRQKGTGRARHGAKSAPIFVGGGIAFGPKPRDFSMKLNQNMRRVALFSALSAKLRDV